MRQQWFTHVRLLIAHPPRYSETSTAALTTPALDRRSLRWFGVSACTATPEDLPPSLAQHGSCRRSSTSSSLPFRTHVGAGNSAVVVDLLRCGPMLSSRVPNRVPIPGPRMEREAPGQRPRPNYGHPQVAQPGAGSSPRVRSGALADALTAVAELVAQPGAGSSPRVRSGALADALTAVAELVAQPGAGSSPRVRSGALADALTAVAELVAQPGAGSSLPRVCGAAPSRTR